MALTEDLEYETVGRTEVLEGIAGAADTLYKGAIVMLGTDGLIAVANDGAGTVPIGVMKKQHIITSATAGVEKVEIEMGKIWFAHIGAAQADVGELFYPTDDATIAHASATGANLGLCIGFKTGYVLLDTWIKKL
jgi:hypothetical protein